MKELNLQVKFQNENDAKAFWMYLQSLQQQSSGQGSSTHSTQYAPGSPDFINIQRITANVSTQFREQLPEIVLAAESSSQSGSQRQAGRS